MKGPIIEELMKREGKKKYIKVEEDEDTVKRMRD